MKTRSGSKTQRWLSGPFLEQLIRYQIDSHDGQWRLQFDFDTAAWQRPRRSPPGSHCTAYQSNWIKRRAGRHRLFRPARNRAGLSRPQRRRLAALGTDVSLDRPQDPHPCVLLHAGHLTFATSPQTGPERVEWNLHLNTPPGRVAPDSTVRSLIPTPRRERPQPHRHCAL